MKHKHGIEGFAIDSGVYGTRLEIDGSGGTELQCNRDEMLWIIALEHEVHYHSSIHVEAKQLNQSESTLMMWPRSPWTVTLNSPTSAVLAVFRITLDALHKMLAVDFPSGQQSATPSVDFSKFARLVHLPPLVIRNLERLFIQSEQSMFRSITRRGIFLNTFAQMLELVYGNFIEHCPFHIDSDTERKIRSAQQMLINNLQETYDLQSLAHAVALPKPVLKEGFSYIFGKSIPAYMQDYKFEKATTMLESGKYLIKEVAFTIGYQNPSHFISAFKQRYGTTPKQWLKQATASEQVRTT